MRKLLMGMACLTALAWAQGPDDWVHDISVKDADISEAVAKIVGSQGSFVIGPGVVGKATFWGSGMPRIEALRNAANQVNAEVGFKDGVYRVYSKTHPTGDDVYRAVVPMVESKRTDLRAVLWALFGGVRVSYSIAPEVQGATVTLSLRGKPFETVLRELLRQVDATYMVDGGIYSIIPRSAEPIPGQLRVIAGALTQSPKDEAAVKGILANLEKAWAAGDAKLWGAQYSEDAQFTIFNGMRIRGRKAIVANHERFFSTIAKTTKMKLKIDELRFIRPDVAVVLTQSFVAEKPDPFSEEPGFKQLFVVSKAKGKWLIEALQNTQISKGF